MSALAIGIRAVSKAEVEFYQANRDRTMAGAYSPRALPTATVATPVTWDDLDAVDPAAFTIRSSLDGKTTLPHRIAWIAYPSAAVEAPGVEFLIDGKVVFHQGKILA
mgnify:CR=1 FL=1